MTNEVFDIYGSDPIALYKSWYAEAEKAEINDPDAACIATVGRDGQPSARMILIKEIDKDGLKFHTSSTSHKGRDIAQNQRVALCIYWKSTRKQIRIEGHAEMVSEAESDAYFKTRPPARQIGAWASDQSKPFEKQDELRARVAKYETQFADKDDIPRPEYWKGYRIVPQRMEFWIGNKDRLHKRFVYMKQDDGSWHASWLYP